LEELEKSEGRNRHLSLLKEINETIIKKSDYQEPESSKSFWEDDEEDEVEQVIDKAAEKAEKKAEFNRSQTIGKKYFAMLERFISDPRNKRFGLQAVMISLMQFYALERRQNYIACLPKDRKDRYRAKQKYASPARGAVEFKRDYAQTLRKLPTIANGNKIGKLKTHANKRGFYKQTWFIGNARTEEEDLKRAFCEGPELFYFPGEFYHLLFLIIRDYHWTLKYCFDAKPDIKKVRLRLSKICIEAARKAGVPRLHNTKILGMKLQQILSQGLRARAQGSGFGRTRGRPIKVNNTVEAVKFMRTTEGQEVINNYLSALSKEEHIVVRSRRIAVKIKADLIKRICLWSARASTYVELQVLEKKGERLNPKQLLVFASESKKNKNVCVASFKEVAERHRWLRPTHPQYKPNKNNSPRYFPINKYHVSKESAGGPEATPTDDFFNKTSSFRLRV
jgi:hypothetical protein